ncbi:MAG TPA: maleylpyruvate isomerase family mycothiol-dependent enzyme [Nocardioides sp.]|uniref:maleylpyruvate isomerase family mycothiol-dependent enzyme n=1 Tax=Nocardioides sp. TaxID=35761 RepID=UPI002F404870
MEDMWSVVASERGALADDLAGLDDAAWDTRSLCEKWTVRDAVAHMIATAEMTPPKFAGKMIASGFDFQKMTAREIADKREADPAAELKHLRAVRDRRTGPPGPTTSWLGETIVHAEDVRRPLGLSRTYPMDAVVAVADFYRGSNILIGSKKRIAGVTLKATDTDWSHGTGPAAEGPMLSLLLAMTGRTSALADLAGPGVETLQSQS